MNRRESPGDSQDPGSGIGWYNDETGQWDKPKPSLPAFMRISDPGRPQPADDLEEARRIQAENERLVATDWDPEFPDRQVWCAEHGPSCPHGCIR